MDTTADVLRHAKCGCQGINGSCGMSEDRKLGDPECLTDGVNIIYKSLAEL